MANKIFEIRNSNELQNIFNNNNITSEDNVVVKIYQGTYQLPEYGDLNAKKITIVGYGNVNILTHFYPNDYDWSTYWMDVEMGIIQHKAILYFPHCINLTFTNIKFENKSTNTQRTDFLSLNFKSNYFKRISPSFIDDNSLYSEINNVTPTENGINICRICECEFKNIRFSLNSGVLYFDKNIAKTHGVWGDYVGTFISDNVLLANNYVAGICNTNNNRIVGANYNSSIYSISSANKISINNTLTITDGIFTKNEILGNKNLSINRSIISNNVFQNFNTSLNVNNYKSMIINNNFIDSKNSLSFTFNNTMVLGNIFNNLDISPILSLKTTNNENKTIMDSDKNLL